MICNFKTRQEYKEINQSNWIKITDLQLKRGFIHEKQLIDFQKNKIDILRRSINKAEISLLDAGCGSAWLADEIENVNYTGLDFNSQLIDQLQKKYVNHLGKKFVCADIEDTLSKELYSERYDIIICNFLFLELPHLDSAFKNICHLLRSGGYLLIMGLNPIFELLRDSSNYNDLILEIESLRTKNNFGPVLKKPFYSKDMVTETYYYRIIYSLNDLIQAAIKQDLLLLEIIDQFNSFSKELFAPIYNFLMFSNR